jgi:hypothetical protein
LESIEDVGGQVREGGWEGGRRRGVPVEVVKLHRVAVRVETCGETVQWERGAINREVWV